MIWPWLLFDYYHPKSPKSRFVQCFQWLCNHSEKPGNLVENRITLENTAFYQLMPENSDRRHCSCQALSLCKKARRKLMHLSLRLAFARTDCTPMTHCVPMGRNSWNFWVFRADIFFGSAWWQAAPIKISAVFLVFSMVSAFWGKVFGACCFILLVATVQPKKILWVLWNLVRSARFCQRSALWRLSCFVRFRS